MIQQFHFWVFIQKKQKHYSKRYMHPIFPAAIAKTWKESKCPSMDKGNVVYIYNGILFSYEKD